MWAAQYYKYRSPRHFITVRRNGYDGIRSWCLQSVLKSECRDHTGYLILRETVVSA
ncbi:MAG: hypothetical protein ACLSG9_10675 [Eubacterium sp.]